MSQDDPFRIELTEEDLKDVGPDAWADAMKEFEEWDKKEAAAAKAPPKPAPAPPKPAAAPPVAPPAPKAAEPVVGAAKPAPAPAPVNPNRARYEELCKTPSMRMEAHDLDCMTAFSEIIGKVNEIGNLVEKLVREHPDFAPERFTNLWASNMKEASQVMMKEFHAMRLGRQQKKYDQRNICRACHSVFMVPLPGGICDECRAAKSTRPKAEQT